MVTILKKLAKALFIDNLKTTIIVVLSIGLFFYFKSVWDGYRNYKVEVAKNELLSERLDSVSTSYAKAINDSSVVIKNKTSKIEDLRGDLKIKNTQIGELQKQTKGIRDVYKDKIIYLKDSCRCPDCPKCIGIKIRR